MVTAAHRRAPSPRALNWSRHLLLCSAAAYMVSLWLPAYVTSPGRDGQWPGYFPLLLGLPGLLTLHFSWLANPLLLVAWLTRRSRHWWRPIKYAVVALLFALSFLLMETVTVGDAGDYPYTVGSGYYVWLVSIGLSLAAFWVYLPTTLARRCGRRLRRRYRQVVHVVVVLAK